MYLPRIRERRIEKEIKQVFVAKKMEIKQPQYSRYETGQDEMKIGTLIILCKALDISADYILGISDVKRRFGE